MEGVIAFAPSRRHRRPHTNPHSKTKKQTSRLQFSSLGKNQTYSEGMERMISESPGSVMLRQQTRKYLPHAVPKSTLLPL